MSETSVDVQVTCHGVLDKRSLRDGGNADMHWHAQHACGTVKGSACAHLEDLGSKSDVVLTSSSSSLLLF